MKVGVLGRAHSWALQGEVAGLFFGLIEKVIMFGFFSININ